MECEDTCIDDVWRDQIIAGERGSERDLTRLLRLTCLAPDLERDSDRMYKDCPPALTQPYTWNAKNFETGERSKALTGIALVTPKYNHISGHLYHLTS